MFSSLIRCFTLPAHNQQSLVRSLQLSEFRSTRHRCFSPWVTAFTITLAPAGWDHAIFSEARDHNPVSMRVRLTLSTIPKQSPTSAARTSHGRISLTFPIRSKNITYLHRCQLNEGHPNACSRCAAFRTVAASASNTLQVLAEDARCSERVSNEDEDLLCDNSDFV